MGRSRKKKLRIGAKIIFGIFSLCIKQEVNTQKKYIYSRTKQKKTFGYKNNSVFIFFILSN